MTIKQVKNVADIPSSELDDWGPVPEPVSETVSQLRGRIINENPDGSEAGIWECTPGTWTRLVMDAEISSFVAGHALFHPEDGETIDIRAGDRSQYRGSACRVYRYHPTFSQRCRARLAPYSPRPRRARASLLYCRGIRPRESSPVDDYWVTSTTFLITRT